MTDPWQDYVIAARRLDAVRQGAATAADEHSARVRAAHEGLAEVRARLAPQRLRLRELGVSEVDLVPSPPEAAAATHATAGGPASVLAAVAQARGNVEAVDAALASAARPAPLARVASWLSWSRGSRLYALAALVLLVLLGCAGTLWALV